MQRRLDEIAALRQGCIDQLAECERQFLESIGDCPKKLWHLGQFLSLMKLAIEDEGKKSVADMAGHRLFFPDEKS